MDRKRGERVPESALNRTRTHNRDGGAPRPSFLEVGETSRGSSDF